MPTNLHLTPRNEDVRLLARRAYRLEGPDAAAIEERAVAAILRANPHLDANVDVPAGAVIALPEIESVSPHPHAGRFFETAEAADHDRAATLNQMRGALSDASKQLTEGLRYQRRREDSTVKTIERHRQDLVSIDDRFAEHLNQLDKDANARLEAMKDEANENRKRLKILTDGLDQLQATLKRTRT